MWSLPEIGASSSSAVNFEATHSDSRSQFDTLSYQRKKASSETREVAAIDTGQAPLAGLFYVVAREFLANRR